MAVHCTECGWEGDWDNVHVERADGSIGADPHHEHDEPPYYCPECGEESVEEGDADTGIYPPEDREAIQPGDYGYYRTPGQGGPG